MTSSTISSRPTAPAAPDVCDTGLWRGAIGLAVLSIVGFGGLYSLAGVALGQAFFPGTASGSLITVDGEVIGSSLVAQPFAADRYFHPRPSAGGHQPMVAGGSNQARTNPELRQRIEAERGAVARSEGVALSEVPSDLVTQSGGGFDPHISAHGARIQMARVARASGADPDMIAALVSEHTHAPQFGILGRPRVNVLELNLALDRTAPPVTR